ncbi:MAG TPA: hypothetical protein VM450_14340, partial [Thermomicrobiales bacterium]|nr:hypothetical protein [Thermomicrobiales bacterium]
MVECLGRVLQLFVVLVLAMSSALPIPAVADSSPQTYIGHAARLTAEIPAHWRVDPTGRFDYVGDDGFVRSDPLAAMTLDEACVALSKSSRFDSDASVMTARFEDHAACQLSGQSGGVDVQALVVHLARPFSVSGEYFAYAAFFADPKHFFAIEQTLDLSPERVTPEAYVDSILDLVEARAHWSDEVDWELARLDAMAQVDGMTELSQT